MRRINRETWQAHVSCAMAGLDADLDELMRLYWRAQSGPHLLRCWPEHPEPSYWRAEAER